MYENFARAHPPSAMRLPTDLRTPPAAAAVAGQAAGLCLSTLLCLNLNGPLPMLPAFAAESEQVSHVALESWTD